MPKQVKVWNITDDTTTSATPRNMMVLGKNLRPGQGVKVDEERLKKAHKTRKDIDNKLLHVGPIPPPHYLRKKKPPRAKLAKGVGRTHSQTVKDAAGEAAEKVEVKLGDTVEPPKEEVAVEAEPVEAEADTSKDEDSSEESSGSDEGEDSGSSFGRRRKKRR